MDNGINFKHAPFKCKPKDQHAAHFPLSLVLLDASQTGKWLLSTGFVRTQIEQVSMSPKKLLKVISTQSIISRL